MMEEGKEKKEGFDNSDREEIYSQAIRAGKRTYFFDVKATRRNDYYLTITESKKRYHKDGRFFYEKHKVFLYKEDFDKFVEGLTQVIDYIKENRPPELSDEDMLDTPSKTEVSSYTNVEFEDLEKVEESVTSEESKED